MPESTLFAAILALLADPRIFAVAAIGALAGLVRGFTGFGSALIYVPLVSAVYDPLIAATTLLMVDLAASAPFTIRAIPHADWGEVLPLVVASAATVPLGVAALVIIDPVPMRWIIAAIVLGALIVLAAGWRYHGKPRLPVTIGVGALAGLLGGATQMSGPPVIVYWLGGAISAEKVRANMLAYLGLASVVSGVSYFAGGLFTLRAVAVALVAGPAFGLAMIAGARMFDRSSDASYRRVAYAIIAFAAMASLPVLDRFYRS